MERGEALFTSLPRGVFPLGGPRAVTGVVTNPTNFYVVRLDAGRRGEGGGRARRGLASQLLQNRRRRLFGLLLVPPLQEFGRHARRRRALKWQNRRRRRRRRDLQRMSTAPEMLRGTGCRCGGSSGAIGARRQVEHQQLRWSTGGRGGVE
eukprot:GHVT01034000.1.p2 GENE.GHVT01034000.1~~GHVT01034000.1.p2  ORF type:complete len:150 (-),score=32.69 GHVT01034000.1:781-1230(-)